MRGYTESKESYIERDECHNLSYNEAETVIDAQILFVRNRW